jgi:transglutaminase-like putative cysteine protease
MVPELSRMVRRLTFGLLALAAAATEIAAVDTRPILLSLGQAAVWVLGAAVVAALLPVPPDPRRKPPVWVGLALLGLFVAPFLVEPLRRYWTGDGYPLELQMVMGLRNLGLGLAAAAGYLLCLRAACVTSLFLMLFAAAMTDHPAVLVVLGMYTAVGSVWLMLVYWIGLRNFFVSSDYAVEVHVQPGKERLPWAAALIALLIVACLAGLLAFGPKTAVRTLAELLPTSGGTGDYDPYARGGVNDGDDEVKGNNPFSTGMTQTDTFLDSPLPSLYDIINDRYGEPIKPKDQERAIALDPKTKLLEREKDPADNLRPNREFTTARKSPREQRRPTDRAARALFEVQGVTPLHIRVRAYDRFDGLTWHEATPTTAITLLDKDPRSNWMYTRHTYEQQPLYAASESHSFKITGQLGTLVPTPPQLECFLLGRVDRTDFFTFGQDRILRMADRNLPNGVVVQTQCRTVDPRGLAGLVLPQSYPGERRLYSQLPELDPRVTALFRAWVADLPADYEQIQAVLTRLRGEYTHDRSVGTPPDCTDPLAHFLLVAKRGPDYQFASATVLALRALGYPSRLVSGFYVDPDHYDPLTRHTPVVDEDLHFWPEVLLPTGDWIVLEPTPGYRVLGPTPPLLERLAAALLALLRWLIAHWLELLVTVAGLVVLWQQRRRLIDTLALWHWRVRTRGLSWQQRLRGVVPLLERRARWAGIARQPGQTLRGWLGLVRQHPLAPAELLPRFTVMLEWAVYAPDLAPPWPPAEALATCDEIVRLTYPMGLSRRASA